jgi:isopenicillin N synthase-like dioxygenase
MALHPTDFTSIPLIDFQKSLDPATKPQFLKELREAAAGVGFLYLQNPPIAAIGAVSDYTKRLFTIPQSEKDKLDLGNVPHFLGYTRPGTEHTKGKMDAREFFDFGTPCECPWEEGKPEYLKLWGPSQVQSVCVVEAS